MRRLGVRRPRRPDSFLKTPHAVTGCGSGVMAWLSGCAALPPRRRRKKPRRFRPRFSVLHRTRSTGKPEKFYAVAPSGLPISATRTITGTVGFPLAVQGTGRDAPPPPWHFCGRAHGMNRLRSMVECQEFDAGAAGEKRQQRQVRSRWPICSPGRKDPPCLTAAAGTLQAWIAAWR